MPVSMKIRNAKTKRVGEVLVYDEIGESFWGEGLTAKRFAEDLKALGKVDLLNVRINSPGGSVFDGLAIHNSLRNHAAPVEVDIDGLAASIASIIAMAGNTIRMASNAYLMIHNPVTQVYGESTELRKVADLLDKTRATLLDTYAKRPDSDRDAISAAMDAETWFTAEEAIAAGLVDEVTGEFAMAARFDSSRFQHPPAALVAASFEADDDGRERPRLTASRLKTAHMSLIRS